MAFKLGREGRGIKGPSYISGDTPVFRKKLENGVNAEANNDGTIYIDSSIPVDSMKFKKAIRHEKKHMEDMETGRADYGDDWVMWEGDIFFRKEIDGEKVIDGPNGRWPEGHPNHPWEAEAIKAENDKNYD